MTIEEICLQIEEEAKSARKQKLKTVLSPEELFSVNSVVSFHSLAAYEGREYIRNLYSQLLDREPSEEEVNHYLKMIENNAVTKERLFCIFALSEECLQHDKVVICKGIHEIDADLLLKLDDEDYIKSLYLWILGRPAGQAELDQYKEKLKSGMPKALVLYLVSRSAEASRRDIHVNGLRKDVYLMRAKYLIKKMLHR